MKKLLLVICAFGLIVQTNATHLMGGQITSQNIGGLTYAITLTVYRDTNGIPMSPVQILNYYDNLSNPIGTNTVPQAGMSNFGNGVEEYVFLDTITFPSSGDYTIIWEDCCRNCAILNLTNPCGESFYLTNELWADSSNSSPVFLNPPIPIAQLMQPYIYNPLPFDADGDSLYWTLDIPLSMGGLQVVGFTLPPSDTSMPFTMNQTNGEISFMPNTVGNFVVSVLVKEYRAGVEIGTTRRDYQILVIPTLAPPPNISTTSNSFPYSGKQFYITPGTGFTFTMTASDIDNRYLEISGVGEAMILSNPLVGAYTNGFTTASAALSWTPTTNEARVKPYVLALRVAQYHSIYKFITDHTIQLFVGSNPIGISENSNANFNDIYPNPSSGNFNVVYNTKNAGQVTISVYTLTGNKVSEQKIQVNSGMNVISVNDINLVKGNYMVQISNNGKVETKQITIEK
ncbi:MAG: T9SS type A sorting domain-containing protein [Bacteroidetes bacterium]|nr:T9SS type A sorting domain-containing protein [Bacteroidota bacterium]